MDGLSIAIAAVLRSELEPLCAEIATLRAEVAALRASSPVATLVSLATAAPRLGVSVATLRRRIRTGSIPASAVHQGGRGHAIRVDLSKLKAPDEETIARIAYDARTAQ